MPSFFGYERDIKSELELLGAVVDWLPDRPFDHPFPKAVAKVCSNCVLPYADILYESLLEGFGATHYDYILIINGQTLSDRMLKRLIANFPSAKCILYMWDSFKNRRRFKDKMSYFDKVSTFDPDDALNYQIELRPLFFGRGFDIEKTSQPKKYQVSFIGTAHSDRFAVVDRVRKNLPKGTNAYWYLYLQSPWVFNLYRLTKPDMRHANRQDFQFEPIAKTTIQKVFEESLAVLDIEHPNQCGLTMRSLEALGARKKLITTNVNIQKYDLFSKDNILIINRENPILPKEFFESPYIELPSDLRNRYSITGWLEDILDIKR
jgi:hypothetical protein